MKFVPILFVTQLLGVFAIASDEPKQVPDARAQARTTLTQSCEQIRASEPDRRFEAGAAAVPARLRDPSQLRAVALVVHGLGHNKETMWNVRSMLLSRGVESFAITLAGHGSDEPRMGSVSREQWLANVYVGYCMTKAYADEKGVPFYNAGFSAGALIFEDLINLDLPTPVESKKSVYFSPAFRTKGYVDQAPHMYWLGGSTKLFNGVKLGAVRAMLHSKRHVGVVTKYARSNREVEVFIDPKDPLISYRGTENLIKERNLTGWRLTPLKTTVKGYEHVTIFESRLDDPSKALLSAHLDSLLGPRISESAPALE